MAYSGEPRPTPRPTSQAEGRGFEPRSPLNGKPRSSRRSAAQQPRAGLKRCGYASADGSTSAAPTWPAARGDADARAARGEDRSAGGQARRGPARPRSRSARSSQRTRRATNPPCNCAAGLRVRVVERTAARGSEHRPARARSSARGADVDEPGCLAPSRCHPERADPVRCRTDGEPAAGGGPRQG